ncbi:MAG: hypothetical protein HYS18_15970 [Burkholderiales bacterium]|nr:hypothetical protein [Burkholderiales bacterium]
MRRDSDNRTGLPATVPTVNLIKAGFLWAVLFLCPAHSSAHEFSIQECVEGSDFIKNTALARDRGINGAAFLSKIRDDIEVIQAFPAQLRWFIQDDEDASFLLDAATAVFQDPKAARLHQRDFFVSCLSKAKSDGRWSSGS